MKQCVWLPAEMCVFWLCDACMSDEMRLLCLRCMTTMSRMSSQVKLIICSQTLCASFPSALHAWIWQLFKMFFCHGRQEMAATVRVNLLYTLNGLCYFQWCPVRPESVIYPHVCLNEAPGWSGGVSRDVSPLQVSYMTHLLLSTGGFY